ncbi:MAG: O-antigen ligase family protein [bacterium]
MQSFIVSTLYLLTSLIPLTFTTFNSELFEFPKFILLLSGTLVITIAWAIHLYQTKTSPLTIVHRPSYISLGVLAILITQTLATIFSIHPYTSFWGYYSRYHGGLLTTICYTIIYFAALKWLDNKSTQKLIKISVTTALFISLYAIAEHFGIDKNLWIQDVQNRVFSTLGQPNWLAAYLIPNFFLSLYLFHNHHPKNYSPLIHYSLSIILFVALLFTKSRSGLLAFTLSYLTYWLLMIRQFSFTKIKSQLFVYSAILLVSIFVFRTPITIPTTQSPQGTTLDSGGTESGDIRKIVWEGALRLIAKYPLLGTGPETFAYTYYWTRPTTHNLTSEWDFLYNKAHNEYLNIAAGAGILGLLAYLAFHFAVLQNSLTLIPKSTFSIYPVLGASLVGFTLTNFFGFSVIPVYLMMMLVSVLPSTISRSPKPSQPLTIGHWPLLLLIFIPLIYPARLFFADLAYAKGKSYLDASQPAPAIPFLLRATHYRPQEALFHSSLGEAYALLGQTDFAVKEAKTTRALNPAHLNYFKSRAKIYLTLSLNDLGAQELEQARSLAPTDPKLAYNLGLVYTRLNKPGESEQQFRDAISLKPNYADPYYALTLLFEQTKQTDQLPALLTSAKTNLSTYSGQLREKISQHLSPIGD